MTIQTTNLMHPYDVRILVELRFTVGLPILGLLSIISCFRLYGSFLTMVNKLEYAIMMNLDMILMIEFTMFTTLNEFEIDMLIDERR